MKASERFDARLARLETAQADLLRRARLYAEAAARQPSEGDQQARWLFEAARAYVAKARRLKARR